MDTSQTVTVLLVLLMCLLHDLSSSKVRKDCRVFTCPCSRRWVQCGRYTEDHTSAIKL